jgi:hypothetical protein
MMVLAPTLMDAPILQHATSIPAQTATTDCVNTELVLTLQPVTTIPELFATMALAYTS